MPIGVLSRLGSKEQFLILIILVVGSLFLLKSFGGSKEPVIPEEFANARLRGASIAEEIVSLSQESKKNLELISGEDAKGNYAEAYDLVLVELSINKKARNKALALSSELAIMVKELPEVRKREASIIGLQAAVDASELVKKLIDYNDYATHLLGALNSRFIGEENDKTSVTIQSILEKMNKEAEAINELNNKYRGLMTEFDRLAR